ncbi:hypothetical protein M419DRAFT_38585 [Trichoderma reesei RUT C-30]|uniref:Carrier domain-containing protein n=1 Tax=Hypocrea jecorina (strain ATCC 56765 / BCRC 32924 / NRRL 11460 / Rut C-30) TaxID=1344414 RepID=A0A024S1J5_HYPJR|nr:hypothetical protein M419DRAFT_38585 [Trichoderma reesei RUT C-30]
MAADGRIDSDPYSQKLFEVVHECLEDACEVNYRGEKASVACYVAMPGRKDVEAREKGNASTVELVSKQFEFRGPSLTIEDAEDSASLVTLDEACKAVRNGSAQAALVAGINLIATGATADDLEGEAVVAVFIKPLSDAVRDGNPIQAVIRAASSDSSDAEVVECSDVLIAGSSSQPDQGDLKSASGLVSLIKAMASLEHQDVLYSATTLSKAVVVVNVQRLPKPADETPSQKHLDLPSGRAQRIRINFAGKSGHESHFVIEPHRQHESPASNDAAGPQLVLFSANNVTSLNQQMQLHHDFARSNPHLVSDIAYTRAIRREALDHRAFSIIGNDGVCLSTASPAKCPVAPPSITMVFSGQGAQWAGMGKELLRIDAFRNDIKSMDSILRQLKTPPSWTIEEEIQRSASDPLCRINSVETACVVSTALQVALFHQYERLGLKAEAVVGHSSGEIAAAYAAGYLNLKEATVVAYYYGYAAAMSVCDGAMAVAGLSAEETREFLRDGAVVACENSPTSTTISGDRGVVEDIMASIQLSRPQVTTRKLRVDTAFHSHHMETVSAEFLRLLQSEGITSTQQTTRNAVFMSSVSNTILTSAKDFGPHYFVNNLVSPVRFSSAVMSILDTTPTHGLFLEIGPHSTLSGPLSQICSAASLSCNYISSQSRETDCLASLLSAIGRLWQNSVALSLDTLFTGQALSGLPRYPWNYGDDNDSDLADANKMHLSAKDRRAQILKRSASRTPCNLSADETPETDLELILRAIWADVLRNVIQIRVEDIGKHHNFFLLGGDSLTTTELATAAYRHGIRLSPTDVTENPELVRMAAVAVIDDAEEINNAKPVSWDTVVKHCGSLRSRIVLVNSQAWQFVVATDTAWDAPVYNVDVNEYLKESRSFTMSYGDCLSRSTLLHQENGDIYFVWIVHHAVFDGLSMKIVLDSLQNAYHSMHSIEPPPPYSNFIRYIGSLDSNRSREYWRKELDGAQRSQFPVASISPTSRDRVFTKSMPFRNSKASITTATIIRAAWALVLAQYCGSDDVCFGMTLSGRQAPVPGLNEIPGPMIATVPVRIHVKRDMLISEFLQHIQSHASHMVAHEQYGLQNISKLGPNAKEQGPVEKTISEEAMRNYFNYPLVLQTRLGNDAIDLEFTYYDDILNEDQLGALFHHFEHVIQQLLQPDDIPLKSVTSSSQWDLQRVREWNSEEPEIVSSCLHEIIERHALKRPDATAVCAWDMTLTYEQLNLAADRLAHYLISNSAAQVQLGDLVHVCFEKSAWFMISILAINKAGAAWAPLDPSHPVQRQKQIVARTNAKLALTSSSNAALCSELVEHIIEVSADLDDMLIAERRGSKGLPRVSPSAAAYVLFTSGSTGTPKGFVMQHQAVCTSQTSAVRRLGMTSDIRMLQFASYVFDMSIGEIVGPWVAGATICVPSEEVRMNGLVEYIRDMKINWVYLTPSFSRTLNPDTLPGLDLMLLAGEAGPTLLKEYLADPEKTEAATVRSLPDWAPYRNLADWNRFYKSGDLCKYNPDGTLVFVTRKDTQIKIRGLRVELGEVEHQIKASLEGVCQVGVDMVTTDGGSSLIAFFCFSNETRMVTTVNAAADEGAAMFLPVTSQLKSQIVSMIGHLSVNLPRYMIPSFFVPCKYMPSITSTKLDRRTLKNQIELLGPDGLSTYSLVDTVKNPPETAMESKLQALWAKRLKMPLEAIGRDDSFLQIGGDSIAVIHFVADARQAGISLSVQDVFDDPRLWRVAAIATSADGDSHSAPIVAPFGLLEPGQIDSVMQDELLKLCGLPSWDAVDDAFPCTKLQEGLMALTTKQPGAYVSKMVFKVPRHVDIGHFKASWERTVAVCSNLRTRIVQLSSLDSIQVIVKEPAQWEVTDNQGIDVFLRQANSIRMSYGSRLARFALVHGDNSDCYFVAIMHHLIFDGWTLALMVQALHAIYRDSEVPRLAPYSAFVRYTLQLDFETSKTYWKAQMDGARRAVFPLPRDDIAVAKSKRNVQISAKEVKIPQTTNGTITRATYLRAAWAMLLARYCSTDDICFGASVSGRNAPLVGVESVLGLVVSTLPVRVRLNPDQSLSDFLRDVQKQSNDMVAHEQFGLQNIARIGSDAKDACNFTSLMVVQPKDLTTGSNGNEAILISTREEQRLAWQSMEDYYNYPLILQCHLGDDSVELEFVYDADVISEFQVLALSNQLDHIIQQLASLDKRTLLRDVSRASPWDLQQSLDWNSHEIVVQKHCMHDLISQRAKLCPDDEALFSTEGSLTYAALDRLSDHVASQLLQYNVQPETIVPICMQKSIWAVVGMIGILKAGGAYMPLDPTHPESRRQALVQEVNAKVIVSSPSMAASCESMAPHTIQVSSSLLALAPETPVDYHSLSNYKKPEPHNAAYVLYTSGSTGKPKGLLVTHSAACTSLLKHSDMFNFKKSSRVFQFASYVFDVSVLDIFLTLILGATLCIPTETERMDRAWRFMTKARVTLACLTPSFIRTLDPDTLPTLQTVAIGGEATTKDILKTWHGRVELINAYGPAEACVNCAGHPFKSQDDSPMTIGRPFTHRLFIVEPDNHDRLTPVGCVGELLVEGHAIARGYINNEEKTKASFVDSLDWLPTQTESDRPIAYKTGDLARFNPDGTVEFFGRQDTQVKLRGQRLELGEIEYHIKANLADVQHVVVDLIEREAGKMIIAFVTFHNYLCDNTPTDAEDPYAEFISNEIYVSSFQALIQELRRVLPGYMIPSIIFPMRDVPHTSSNKIDRRTLRELATSMPRERISSFSIARQDKVPPTTEMELKIQSLWAQVLKIDTEDISKFDNFFEVGGDSISAIHLSNLAAREDILLPIANIFKEPQLASMAACMTIRQSQHTDAQPFSMIEATEVESLHASIRRQCGLANEQELEDIIPCTPLQEGLMALTATRPGSYIARRAYKLADGVDLDRFKDSWERTIKACSSLRTRIVQHGDVSLQAVVSHDGLWEETDGQTLQSYMKGLTSLNMGYGSRLSRHAILSCSNGSTYFIWVAHHAIFDGWTMQIKLDVLQRLYAQEPLPPIRPFANFVQYLSQLDPKAAKDYWLMELEGAQRASFPPAKVTTGNKTSTAQKTQIMKRKLAVPTQPNSSVTKASVLRGAWALVLSMYCEGEDICFGATTSGRQAPVQDLVNIAGPTIATVPVRVRLDRSQHVSEYLQNIQTQASEMVAYEQFGLQNISKLSDSAKHATDFTSLFVVQSRQHEIGKSQGELFTTDSNDETSIENWIEDFFNYPLTVECDLMQDQAVMTLYYDADVLSDLQLQGLCNQFEHVLQELNLRYKEPLGNLSMTSQWGIDFAHASNPDKPLVVESCIHTLIEQRTKLNPESPAVSSWDADFTYSELDENADKLATYLLSTLKVKAGDLVIVCFDKSAWFIVAILAINKIGAAWVLLDPAHPTDRHQNIVGQTKATLALCSLANVPKLMGVTTSVLEVNGEFMSRLPLNDAVKPSVKVSPDDVAYIIFTSGSTGVPKGVVIQHRAICSSQVALSQRLEMHDGVRMLQFSSFVFDASLFEIYSPLISGACVCIPSWDTQMNSLPAFIRERNVTWAFLTPSVASIIRPEDVPCLELVTLGGEAPSKEVVNSWLGKVRLFNVWGPTETTVIAMVHEYTATELSHLTIGRPICGNCWIVNPNDPHQLSPVGTVGEIVVQGPNLLLEYLENPEKTAAATVTSLPHWVPNREVFGRFYKSGDLATYNADGTIRYNSRKDGQIKIRGLRVELGEIEHHIRNNLEGPCQVAVEALKFEAGTHLVAFICQNTDTIPASMTGDVATEDIFLPSTADLRSDLEAMHGFLASALPSYMVPTFFIPCKKMPLVTSSKMDRKLLRRLAAALDRQAFEQYSLYAVTEAKSSPETPMEHSLQQLWADVLKVPAESIGRHDSFLAIGGDSIAIIRLIALAREHGIELRANDIFKDSRLSSVALNAAPIEVDSSSANSAISAKPFHYRLAENVDPSAFKAAWDKTVRLCGILRTRVVHLKGSSVQVVISDYTWDDTKGMTLKSYLQSIEHLEVEYGSRLCRYALIKDENNQTHFIWTMHHAIFDGWSIRVVLATLDNVYKGMKTTALTPYSRFIEYTLAINPQSAADYWVEQLWDAKKASFPPNTSGKLPEYSNGYRSMVTNIKLPDLSATGFTRATILRATWALLLTRYCETDDICFGTTISGRQAPVSGIIDMPGPAIATVPLRIRVPQQKSVAAFLQEVQEQALAMVEFEQFGLQNISKLHACAKEACDFSSLLVVQPKEALDPAGDQDAILIAADGKVETGEYALQNYFSYPLVVQGHLYDESTELVLIYNSAILPEEQIVALSHQFHHVARELVLKLQSNVGSIATTSSWDLQQAMKFNSEVPEAVDGCFHQLFERQARQTPDAMAICAWDGSFTYAELDTAANRLAYHLISQHAIKPDELIHVCFEKSAWYFVSILAINKAGAAWVPLDPSHPLERLGQIVKQTKAQMVLISESHASLCKDLIPIVIEVSASLDQQLSRNGAAFSQNPPTTKVSPANAAYVLFTSGSTGVPKGLVMEHRSVCSSQRAIVRRLGLHSKLHHLSLVPVFVFLQSRPA